MAGKHAKRDKESAQPTQEQVNKMTEKELKKQLQEEQDRRDFPPKSGDLNK